MTPTEMRALAEAAATPGDTAAFVDYIAAHGPTLAMLMWDLVHAAEYGLHDSQVRALHAIYKHIGYEP